MYVESDHYRRIKLLDIQNGTMVSKFELDIIKERDEKFRQNRLATLIQERIEKKRFEEEEKNMFVNSTPKRVQVRRNFIKLELKRLLQQNKL